MRASAFVGVVCGMVLGCGATPRAPFAVRVDAPALDHGRGIRRRVSADFHGVEHFAAVFPTTE